MMNLNQLMIMGQEIFVVIEHLFSPNPSIDLVLKQRHSRI